MRTTKQTPAGALGILSKNKLVRVESKKVYGAFALTKKECGALDYLLKNGYTKMKEQAPRNGK